MEEFLKPKIVYPNMTKFMPFILDDKAYMTNQKCFIITGVHLNFLAAFFNSSLFKYCFADRFPELQGSTRELSKIFFDTIPVIPVTPEIDELFGQRVNDIQKNYSIEKAMEIDKLIFDLYGLSEENRKMIGFIDFGEKQSPRH